jgi:hypothetical protein
MERDEILMFLPILFLIIMGIFIIRFSVFHIEHNTPLFITWLLLILIFIICITNIFTSEKKRVRIISKICIVLPLAINFYFAFMILFGYGWILSVIYFIFSIQNIERRASLSKFDPHYYLLFKKISRRRPIEDHERS